MTWDTDFIAAAGALLTSIATVLMVQAKKRLLQRRSSSAENAVIDAATVYRLLNETAAHLCADRALVLFASNGGGVPAAGKPIYISILYELFSGATQESIMSKFQSVPVDYAYMEMLSQVAEKNVWHGSPDDLRPGFLRTHYQEEGVQYSYVIKIATTETRFYYLSLRWAQNARPSIDLINLETLSLIANLRPVICGTERHG